MPLVVCVCMNRYERKREGGKRHTHTHRNRHTQRHTAAYSLWRARGGEMKEQEKERN